MRSAHQNTAKVATTEGLHGLLWHPTKLMEVQNMKPRSSMLSLLGLALSRLLGHRHQRGVRTERLYRTLCRATPGCRAIPSRGGAPVRRAAGHRRGAANRARAHYRSEPPALYAGASDWPATPAIRGPRRVSRLVAQVHQGPADAGPWLFSEKFGPRRFRPLRAGSQALLDR